MCLRKNACGRDVAEMRPCVGRTAGASRNPGGHGPLSPQTDEIRTKRTSIWGRALELALPRSPDVSLPSSVLCVYAREHFSFSIPLPDCFTKSGRTVSSGIFSMLVQLFGCMILTALVRFCSRQQLGLPIFFVRCPE